MPVPGGNLVPGAPLVPGGFAFTSRIEVSVYDRCGVHLLDLPDSFARQWNDPLNVEGSHQTSVAYWVATPGVGLTVNPAVAAVPYRSVLRYTVDGTCRFGGLVEHRVSKQVEQNEEVDEILTLSGRGLLAIFEEAVIYPPNVGSSPFGDTRAFDYTSTDYDDSGWGTATSLFAQGNTVTGVDDYIGAPGSWPDPTAEWIWGMYSYPSAPVGDNYFRTTFTLGAATLLRIFYTADNGMEFSLDEVPISTLTAVAAPSSSWANTNQIDVSVTAGTHLVAVKGTNVAFAGANPAAILMAAYELNLDGTLGSLVFHTDNTWKAVAYPADPPGFTPGMVLRLLVDEAQARGCLDCVTLAFTDTADSNGNAWTAYPQYYTVGDNLLSVIKAMCALTVDVRVGPATPTLHMYQEGSLGAYRPAAALLAGVNLMALEHDGQA